MSPKDRLQDLQLHAPELFEHVSVKGLKRLIAQVRTARVLGSGSDRSALGLSGSEAPSSRVRGGDGVDSDSQKRLDISERKWSYRLEQRWFRASRAPVV